MLAPLLFHREPQYLLSNLLDIARTLGHFITSKIHFLSSYCSRVRQQLFEVAWVRINPGLSYEPWA